MRGACQVKEEVIVLEKSVRRQKDGGGLRRMSPGVAAVGMVGMPWPGGEELASLELTEDSEGFLTREAAWSHIHLRRTANTLRWSVTPVEVELGSA